MPHHDDAPQAGEFYRPKAGDQCTALVHVPRPRSILSERERAVLLAAVRSGSLLPPRVAPANATAAYELGRALASSANATGARLLAQALLGLLLLAAEDLPCR